MKMSKAQRTPLRPRSEAERWGGVGSGGPFVSPEFPPPLTPPHRVLRAPGDGDAYGDDQ
jgi:hypothetical protein